MAIESAVVLVGVALLGMASLSTFGAATQTAIAGDAEATVQVDGVRAGSPGSASASGAFVTAQQAGLGPVDGAFVRGAKSILEASRGTIEGTRNGARGTYSVARMNTQWTHGLSFLDRTILSRGLGVVGEGLGLENNGRRFAFTQRALLSLNSDEVARLGANIKSLPETQRRTVVGVLDCANDDLFQRMARTDAYFERVREGRVTLPFSEYVRDGQLRHYSKRFALDVTRQDRILNDWQRSGYAKAVGASVRYELPMSEAATAEALRSTRGVRVLYGRDTVSVTFANSAFAVYP